VTGPIPADGTPMPARDLVDGDTVWLGEDSVLLETVGQEGDVIVGLDLDGERHEWDPEATVYVEVDDDEDGE
jgi:hypothetical protein